MVTYRKRGLTWRAGVKQLGRRESNTFATKASAVAWATQREAEPLAGKRGQFIHRTVKQAVGECAERVSPSPAASAVSASGWASSRGRSKADRPHRGLLPQWVRVGNFVGRLRSDTSGTLAIGVAAHNNVGARVVRGRGSVWLLVLYWMHNGKQYVIAQAGGTQNSNTLLELDWER